MMVGRSARFAHPLGNRRYKEFLFFVEGDELKNVYRLASVAVPLAPLRENQSPCWFCTGLHKLAVFDECRRCDGHGCRYCDQGLTTRNVACPYCPPGA